MTERDPAWLAGYRAAMTVDLGFPVQAILVSPEYDECQRMDFVTGFFVGERDHRNARIMDEIERGSVK